jgi:hypothetical protein
LGANNQRKRYFSSLLIAKPNYEVKNPVKGPKSIFCNPA